MSNIRKVTGAELQIVNILFDSKQPMMVQEIVSRLLVKNIDWSKETVRKFLERLEKKEVVASIKKGKLRYYYCIVSKKEIENDEAKKVVDFHFQGSLKNFLVAFTCKNKLSNKEINEIKDWIDHLDDE